MESKPAVVKFATLEEDEATDVIRIFKQILIGLGAALLAVLGFSGISSGTAATSVGGDGDVEATTSASADTLEACSWYVTGLASTIVLANEDDMEYVGNDYVLQAEDNEIQIFFSASDTPSERCSFYDDERGVSVEVSWVGNSFTTGTADDSMDFTINDPLESGDPDGVTLDIAYTDDDCSADWDAGATKRIGVDLLPLTPASITDVSTYTPTSKTSPTFASCMLNATYSTTIPGSKTPQNPGSSYNFTGPILTTTVMIDAD